MTNYPRKKFPIVDEVEREGVVYRTEVTLLDGEAVRYLICPNCGTRGLIDDDQFFGRVSIDCPNCEFHKRVAIGR